MSLIIGPEDTPVSKPLWMIAADEKAEAWQRGLAIYSLFENQVTYDVTLKTLAGVLRNPNWIKEEDVSRVEMMSGYWPPQLYEGYKGHDTLFSIWVFSGDDSLVIYVRVDGIVDKRSFISTGLRSESTSHDGAKIIGWAISPSREEYIKKHAKTTRIADFLKQPVSRSPR